ncbi:MAG: hypothetical protein ACTSU2_07610 [Promethearchaeota archaeon]
MGLSYNYATHIYNVFICGIGGQGVITLGNVIRNFLYHKYDNIQIQGTESRGVSQREGSVIATVRFDYYPFTHKIENAENMKFDKKSQRGSNILKLSPSKITFGPEIPKFDCDLFIALEPIEFLRNIQYINPNTSIFVNNAPILPKNIVLDLINKQKKEPHNSENMAPKHPINDQINNSPLAKLDFSDKNIQRHLIEYASKLLNSFTNIVQENHIPQNKENRANESISPSLKSANRSHAITKPRLSKLKKSFEDIDPLSQYPKIYSLNDLKTFSSYPNLIDIDFSSLMINKFSSIESLNFVMLGFALSILNEPMLSFADLKEFVSVFYEGNDKLIVKNQNAMDYGRSIAASYIINKNST